MILAHVGDSRAYLLHEGELRQLTDDHSWVGEMVRRGELTPAEAAIHPHRSVITRALGTERRSSSPTWSRSRSEPGDRLLLCSDGLSGHGLRRRSSQRAAPAGRTARRRRPTPWWQAALAGGGEDNVTVVVVDAGPPDSTGRARARKDRAPRASTDEPAPTRTTTRSRWGPTDRGQERGVVGRRASCAAALGRMGRQAEPPPSDLGAGRRRRRLAAGGQSAAEGRGARVAPQVDRHGGRRRRSSLALAIAGLRRLQLDRLLRGHL